MLLLASQLFGAQTGKKEFRLPAGEAATTLKLFIEQSGEEVLYLVNSVKEVRTREVRGAYSPREALELMVAGTPLVVVQEKTTGALSVKRVDDPNAPRATSESRPDARPEITAAAVAGASSGEEETIVLSPFEVNSSGDVGYLAQNTLGGTRLNTSLKDTAASVSVLTEEFLADIGATTTLEAMRYGVNAYEDAEDNSANTNAESYNQSFGGIRIRGLPGATRTQNYIGNLYENDLYNVERIDQSRGPNSILFGLGSAAGVLNSGTKQANLQRASGSISHRLDSWGGYRATLDVNRPLIRGRLALRLNLLQSEEGHWRDFGHNDQKRMHLATKYKLSERGQLRIEYERSLQDRYRPRPFIGVDRISYWQSQGQPLFDGYRLNDGNPANDLTAAQALPPTGGNALAGVVNLNTANWGVYVTNAASQLPAYNARNTAVSDGIAVGADPIFTNFSFLRKETDLYGQWIRNEHEFEAVSAALDYRFSRTVNAELVYNRQHYQNLYQGVHPSSIFIAADPNAYLPIPDATGRPIVNPNRGAYYLEGYYERRPQTQTKDVVRATLSHELSLGRWGRLRSAGLYEHRRYDNRVHFLESYWVKDASAPVLEGLFHPDPKNSANRAFFRHYITQDQLNARSASAPFPNVTQHAEFLLPNGQRQAADSVVIPRSNINNAFELQDSTMLVSQLQTLQNRLVLTGGLRWEKMSVNRAPTITGANNLLELGAMPAEPENRYSTRTHNMGMVAHLTSWASLFANRAVSQNLPGNNLVLNEDPRSLEQGVRPPMREGATTDFGVKFDLFENRVFMNVAYYETSVRDDLIINNFTAGIATPIRSIWETLTDAGVVPAGQAPRSIDAVAALMDSETKGWEVELVANPTSRLRLTANFATAEAKQSNIGKRLRRYMETHKPLWLSGNNGDLLIGQLATTPGPDYGNSSDFIPAGLPGATGTTTNNTVREYVMNIEDVIFDNHTVIDGSLFRGQTRYRFNFRAAYAFRDGWLKGFTVGAGARITEGRVIDVLSPNAEITGSLTDPSNGRVVTDRRVYRAGWDKTYDASLSYEKRLGRGLTWRVQLNVNNLLNNQDLIVNLLDTSTEADRRIMFRDPRQILLTNTLSF